MAHGVVQKELSKLKSIIRVLHSASADLELKVAARISVRELVNIVDCDVCAAMLVKRGRVEILAERGFSERYGKVAGMTDMPLIEYFVNKGQAVLVTDVQLSSASKHIHLEYPINSLICTPIIGNDRVRGIIYLDSAERNAFDKEDLELTKLLAAEISIAFERSLHHSQFQKTLMKDTVTGCFDRSKFDQDIITEIAIAEEYGRHLSLMMVNVDWLKAYDNSHGRRMRNTFLRELAHLLIHNLRPYDIVYRYGRETFAVLMADTEIQGALSACSRLQNLREREQSTEEKIDRAATEVMISMGVASFPLDANCGEDLVQAAESALSLLFNRHLQ